MKKGIIMEIDNEFLTLLTPEGEFLHSRKQNLPYAIGEEIHFFPLERVKTSKSFNPFKNIIKCKPVWALMAAFVILLGSFFPMYQNNKAYAYMSIDVNPSIELAVNKKMQVVKITGFNKDGKKIVSHLNNWKKKNVSKLAQTIIAEMNKEGYLNTKEQVIISTVRTKEPDVKVEKKLKESIEEIKESVDKQKVELTFMTATPEELVKAHKHGITTGKLQTNKTQASTNGTSTVKPNKKDKPADSKGIITKPNDSIPSGLIKQQAENKAIQNKGIADMKKQSEKQWINGKSKSPGQLKKIDENQLKQNQGQPKKQNNQKEKTSVNKKVLNQEEQKENDSPENTVKNNNNKNNKEKKDNQLKGKNKEKDTHKNDEQKNKKSDGKHKNSHKYK